MIVLNQFYDDDDSLIQVSGSLSNNDVTWNDGTSTSTSSVSYVLC